MSGSQPTFQPTLRIATRGSAQAMRQTQLVAAALRSHGIDTELVVISTVGDRTQRDNVPLHTIGGQGVFVKEVQQAVLDGRADLAVHSAKDLPSTTAPGLTIGAFSPRRSPADALIGRTLDTLADGATVATGSVRRRAQLARIRPDLNFVELRGNIETRLTKLPVGGAIVMAVAALQVLDLTDRIDQTLDTALFVPAVGQGCVAVEHRSDDGAAAAATAAIDHAATRRAVVVERAYLSELGSGCSLPVGGYVDGPNLHTYLHDAATGRTADEVVVLPDSFEAAIAAARDAGQRALAAVTA